ncbi:MAG: SDR family oxidoreductase [Chloroflexia bacterium]|nr:SDR family oxidoreductase [Chloroflexia bacterium]
MDHQIRSLSGRVALVTGASRTVGIGAAICDALARDGADIAFSHFADYDREMYGTDTGDPARIEGALRATGVRVAGIAIDLSAPDAAENLLNEVEARLGPVTVLVNNAAHSTRDGYQKLDAATLDRHYAVNVRTTALLAVEFARRFQGHEGGRIINLVSGQNMGPMPEELAYVATKGAIAAFSRTLAAELAPRGITVNAVNPGVTDTGWITPELRAELLPQMPRGRFGEPADAARLIAWLASDAAAWVTGQLIDSTGGWPI